MGCCQGGLLPGGVYTLEDLSTSYDQFVGTGLYAHGKRDFQRVGRLRETSVVNYFKEMSVRPCHPPMGIPPPPRGYKSWTFAYQEEPGKRLPSTALAEWVSSVTITMSSVVVVSSTWP